MNSRERAEQLLKFIKTYIDEEEFLINYLDMELQTLVLKGYNKSYEVSPGAVILDVEKAINY